jgi:outer membrane protein
MQKNSISQTFTISVLLAALLVFTTPAQAEFKLATVDINRVLNESKEAKVKRAEFEKKAGEVKKKIDGRKATLMELEKKVKAQGESAQEGEEIEKLRSQARDLERYMRDNDEDLKREFMKLNKTLTDKALKSVEDYAKANQIDLVVDRNEKGRSAVLYGETNLDITEAVIAGLNK